jgi:tRNA pseudouridine55 synthase
LIQETTKQFIGEIEQRPPVFSALSKDGERLYKKARRGELVDIPRRLVQVYEFEITRVALPEVDFRIVCGKGTYIRSIANDFGEALQSGGYLSQLRRTKIGDFSVDFSQDPLLYVKGLGVEE